MEKMWANSGDSHFLEPLDLWQQILPPDLAERMPRSEIKGDEEIVYVDGTSFSRKLPQFLLKKDKERGRETIAEMSYRPPGSRDLQARLADLDEEGIWAEVVYPSLGLWNPLIKDPDLVKVACQAENEWVASEVQGVAPDRLVPTAQLPLLTMEHALAELEHVANIGLHAVCLPSGLPSYIDDYHMDSCEPIWSLAEEAGIVITFHIGSDGEVIDTIAYRGPGGAILNYVETSYGGQRCAMKMVASGALDRHPGLKVLVSEGGATWVPFLGDRMNEAYRQHGMFVKPKLSAPPKEILFRQVYASFQHDESAPATNWAMGYQNVMWGSDYPHIEGTFGHTQKTLHELFDDVAPDVRERITRGAFKELFPHVSDPPGA